MMRASWMAGSVVVILSLNLAAADDIAANVEPQFRLTIDGPMPPGIEGAVFVELARLHERLDRDLGAPDRAVRIGCITVDVDPLSSQQTELDPDAYLEQARRAYIRRYLALRWPQRPDWLDEALSEYYAGGCDEPLTADSYQQLRARYHRNRRPRWQYVEQLDALPSILQREYADAFIRLRPDW